MKKFVSITLALAMSMSLAACGADSSSDASSGSQSSSDAASGEKVVKIGVLSCVPVIRAAGKQEMLVCTYANHMTPTVDIGGETYKVELVYADNGSDSAKHRLNHCKLFLHAVDIFDIRRHIISHRPNRV